MLMLDSANGIAETAPAACTPGRDRIRSIVDAKERPRTLGCGMAVPREHLHHHHALRREPGIHRQQPAEALDEEARAGQQHECDGHFGYDEAAPKRAAHGTGLPFAQHVPPLLRKLQRRDQPEDAGRHRRQRRGEQEHTPVDRGVVQAQQARRSNRDNAAKRPVREGETHRGGDD